MSDKLHRNENEYFARQEAERIQALHARAEAARAELERRTHYMKCPKDGYDLVTQEFHGVPVETCGHCHGIWLDAGELDLVAKHQEPGFFDRVFGDVMTSLRRSPRRAEGKPSRGSRNSIG